MQEATDKFVAASAPLDARIWYRRYMTCAMSMLEAASLPSFFTLLFVIFYENGF